MAHPMAAAAAAALPPSAQLGEKTANLSLSLPSTSIYGTTCRNSATAGGLPTCPERAREGKTPLLINLIIV